MRRRCWTHSSRLISDKFHMQHRAFGKDNNRNMTFFVLYAVTIVAVSGGLALPSPDATTGKPATQIPAPVDGHGKSPIKSRQITSGTALSLLNSGLTSNGLQPATNVQDLTASQMAELNAQKIENSYKQSQKQQLVAIASLQSQQQNLAATQSVLAGYNNKPPGSPLPGNFHNNPSAALQVQAQQQLLQAQQQQLQQQQPSSATQLTQQNLMQSFWSPGGVGGQNNNNALAQQQAQQQLMQLLQQQQQDPLSSTGANSASTVTRTGQFSDMGGFYNPMMLQLQYQQQLQQQQLQNQMQLQMLLRQQYNGMNPYYNNMYGR